jgi:mono/diheme cytochrome c family protein
MFKGVNLTRSARHCAILAWLFVWPTLLLGYMDWQYFYQGAYLLPIIIKIGLSALLVVLLTAALFLMLQGRGESGSILFIYLLGFLTVAAIGYFGGHIVFKGMAPAAPAPTAAAQAGRKLFEVNCSACHSDGGNIITPQYPLKGSRDLDSFDKFLAYIRDPRLANGQKGPMPEFPPSLISDEEAWELYRYLKPEFGRQPGPAQPPVPTQPPGPGAKT